jgi:hypothetical protein
VTQGRHRKSSLGACDQSLKLKGQFLQIVGPPALFSHSSWLCRFLELFYPSVSTLQHTIPSTLPFPLQTLLLIPNWCPLLGHPGREGLQGCLTHTISPELTELYLNIEPQSTSKTEPTLYLARYESRTLVLSTPRSPGTLYCHHWRAYYTGTKTWT